MPLNYSPTLRSRRLRAILRQLREEHALTLDQAARQVDWTGAKLSRIETGQRGAHPNDVRALADLYGITGREREALITLAREARQRGWWQPYGSVLPPGFATYVDLESEASKIATYSPELVPGLLQTEDYARAQIGAAPTQEPDDEIDKRVAVRMKRQQRLTEAGGPTVLAILNEAVLYRQVGGRDALHRQLTHVLDLATNPKISIHILPFAAGSHPGTHGEFVLLEFPTSQDAGIIYVEYLTGRAFLEEPDEIVQYHLVLDHLRARSLSREDSTTLISNIIRRS
ncbi:helix-turn-helix transcriptional regulator [Actinomadura sp. BRA 177]|uniref:helix-turn-helix domain-containing protein n=1 Tax=Actinomadura sp. BRA 177 TaxID=2745202 RepID=UPI001595B45C|nr:helix-turn-helix transcriptional regulator [Actinomadura sp. BRA 177]NVI85955.1 helix-turn-helix domain-containing protein [Actinomadura sp. BRA 177]